MQPGLIKKLETKFKLKVEKIPRYNTPATPGTSLECTKEKDKTIGKAEYSEVEHICYFIC